MVNNDTLDFRKDAIDLIVLIHFLLSINTAASLPVRVLIQNPQGLKRCISQGIPGIHHCKNWYKWVTEKTFLLSGILVG